ncbi:MAG: 2-phosphosulfolactate phosphatase [Spirochaetales bacterium]|jgi:2-phosphosulfolactate phosphatase|nr:2-phosphosulfolactate phosphatase [Spirochaetales bacterium]
MKPIVKVITTAQAAAAVDFTGSVAVVIDVLRATTSIQCIFESGARKVYPVSSVEDARRLKEEKPAALLCGERKGIALEGFDYGNSPAEFLESDLIDREIILTTTNGTLAFQNCDGASRMMSGCMLNARSAARRIVVGYSEMPVNIICAGTGGSFSIEDFYCAGILAAELGELGSHMLSDFARASVFLAEHPVSKAVNSSTCKHLGYLASLGPRFRRDIQIALEADSDRGSRDVPIYDFKHKCFMALSR